MDKRRFHPARYPFVRVDNIETAQAVHSCGIAIILMSSSRYLRARGLNDDHATDARPAPGADDGEVWGQVTFTH
jgi:hypothetical protein